MSEDRLVKKVVVPICDEGGTIEDRVFFASDFFAAVEALLQLCELTCMYRVAHVCLPNGYKEFYWHSYSPQKEDALVLLQKLGRIPSDKIISPELAEQIFGGKRDVLQKIKAE